MSQASWSRGNVGTGRVQSRYRNCEQMSETLRIWRQSSGRSSTQRFWIGCGVPPPSPKIGAVSPVPFKKKVDNDSQLMRTTRKSTFLRRW